ncbi:DNAse [Actinobacillus pleuropneumoniae]|uniref:Mg-dependent DNAse n=2 Tax=Actinobacillus pleuropneumoniae TaxID=715 RepID=A3N3A8_ACTP2|nr:YchF/TatD family DNA exonuclease [Actinobacillus pleuropneumoniae]ABN74894.1 Putative Mg-dependent DNAse [Actinobacillus pleuropneumoniae serovar 5b str. L20]EFL81280.1 putative deoxyribonuclease [Actinobacillus pleuropneumoniae serovar 6 str. Femo]EFM91216.1 Deoxyribonuclease [Actinobacillus pleuropneumoniae serovar 6 str. Femo]MEE3683123.1 YchF/TatD family DNA exonuclease [Actinobacillus pleuropneumoniae]QSZ39882.1 DNAse [Actinobacillus pleuropneumoniae]
MKDLFIIDSHCHLDALDYETRHKNVDQVIENAKARGVHHFISICTTLGRFEAMKALTAHRNDVSLSCGVHPLNIEEEPFDYDKLLTFAQDEKVVAIGETGLDYHYTPETKALQQSLFSQQIDIANKVNKPLIIHTRSARQDTMDMLIAGNAKKCGGVLHCFTEDWNMAKRALDIGFYISISGIITFRNAEELRDVVRKVPLDSLLVETDSPYLAPIPYRGKPNQPAYVRETCEYLAALKGVSTEELARITTENVQNLFKIKL